MSSFPIILASSSPFRKALLERLQIPFDVEVPGIDESPRPGETPQAYVERLAVEKAHAVAARHPRALVIGSDQTAVHGDEIVGKPVDHDDAVRQLQHASGGTVTLYTALALVNTETGQIQSDVVPFTVHFRRFDRDTIERYLDREKPYGCAGSLRAEGLGIALLRKFEGDDPNALIGLPLIRLVDMLESEGVRVP
ncbi:MAG: nucleoside triphosphate pyrophosphatase [Gammaproteobacteria bacterium]|nr:nucleoside triphosphate pyrophosphatase [Gammaproteobacteria bacterium]